MNAESENEYCSPACYFNQIFFTKIGCVDCRYAFHKCELCDHEKCIKCQIGYYLREGECVLIERPTWLRVRQVIDNFDWESGCPIVGILFNKRLHPDVIAGQVVEKPINITLQHSVAHIELKMEVYRDYSNHALTFMIHSNVSFSGLHVKLTINDIDALYSSKMVPLYPNEVTIYDFTIASVVVGGLSPWVGLMMALTEKLAGRSYLDEEQTAQYLRLFRRAAIFNMLQPANQRFFSLQVVQSRRDVTSSETIRMIAQLSSPKHILPHERDYYIKRYVLHNDDVTSFSNVAPYSFSKLGMPLDYSVNTYPFLISLFLAFVGYLSVRLVLFQLQSSLETALATDESFQKSESILHLIQNWFSYELQFKTIWTYNDEVLLVDSIFTFLILLTFDSYINLFVLSLALWSSQMSFESTFESLSSTLLIMSALLFLVYLGNLVFNFYHSINSLNALQHKFATLENLLKQQFNNRNYVTYVEINVHLRRILSISKI